MKNLTYQQVIEIIDLYQQGYGQVLIARKLNRSEDTIRRVLRGQTFRGITGGCRLMNGKRPGNQLAIYNQRNF